VNQLNRLLVLLSVVLCSLSVNFAQSFPYRHYTIKDGLPNTNILSFSQDDKGFVWISTQNGLSRFDGYTFNNFTLSDDNPLKDNIQTTGKDKIFFLVDKKGVYSFDAAGSKNIYSELKQEFGLNKFLIVNDLLYLFSDNNFYIVRNNKIIDSVLITPRSSKDSKILSVCVKNDNAVLIGTTYGLFIYEHNKLNPYSEKIKLPVYSINEDPENNIWIGSTDKIIKLNNNGTISQQINIKIYQPYPIENLLVDNFSNIWFSIKNYGLFVMSNGQTIHIGANLGFGKSQVNFIRKDSEKNIWVGTYGKGLYCFHDIYIKNFNEIDNLSHEFVSCLSLDGKGRLLIGAMNSIDLFQDNVIENLETDFYSYTKEIQKGANNNVFVACISNNNGLLKIINNNNNNYYFITASSVLPDINNSLLAGDWQNNINYYEVSNNGLSFVRSISLFHRKERINKIFRDPGNNIWVGSVSGLSLIQDNQIKYFEDSELLDCPVNDIKTDKDNNIWFATDKGLSKFDGRNWFRFKSIQNYDLKSSTSIIFDKRGLMWVSNPEGLARFDQNKITYWDENSGLAGNEIYSICYDSLRNCMWVGTNEGISRLNLDQYDELEYNPLRIFIDKIFLDDSLVQNSNIELNIDNTIRAEFLSLNYPKSEKIIYQYKFKDLDEDWNETTNPFMEFSSLSPGSYNLLIRSHTLNREWNNPVELTFVVKTPFYKSIYFYFSVILIVVSLVIYLADRRIRQARLKDKENNEIEEKISTLKHQALAAMMNPHFIFNSLTSIQYFINSNDVEGANEYLAKFAKLIRLNLESAEKGFITINEELERLKVYLLLEKMRFGNSLTYTIKLDNEIDINNTQIPNMVIQPFVENALWHGILPKNNGGEINIIFEKYNPDKLRITIADNGIGYKKGLEMKKPGHISKGMKIIEDRLSLLNQGKGSLITIQDLNEIEKDLSGTIVKIVLTPQLIRRSYPLSSL